MATATIDAAFSEQILHDVLGDFEIEFVIGTDGMGVSDGPVILRSAIRFSVGSIPSNAVISAIHLLVTIQATSGAGSDSWDVGPYRTSGTADPEADDETTAYNGCEVTATRYLRTTAFRSTGLADLDIGSAQAITDLTAALSGGVFTLALKMVDEASAPVRSSQFWAYTEDENPQLVVTYTVPASNSPLYWRWRS